MCIVFFVLCKSEDIFFLVLHGSFKKDSLKNLSTKQLSSFLYKLRVYFEIMCILFCYIADENIDIGYELILLSNRDEDFQRPAIQAHVWKNTKYAIGGQDQTALREGGTWLCLNTVQSKIGVLVNLTSRLCVQKNLNAQSRGFLAPNYVNNPEMTLDLYMEELQKTKMNYTGFNYLGLERQSESK
jgi:uncharacterized protein with NRDE domain